jgi:hypothetical protein
VTGEREADFSFSCDGDEPTGLQRTLEPLAARLLEFSIQNILRALQVDAVYTLLEVVDNTATYSVNGRIVIEIFGYRYESPRFDTAIRFISDQGRWAICEVAGS